MEIITIIGVVIFIIAFKVVLGKHNKEIKESNERKRTGKDK